MVGWGGSGDSSRRTPTSTLGWNAVFDRPYDYGLIGWVGVGGTVIQLVVLIRPPSHHLQRRQLSWVESEMEDSNRDHLSANEPNR